MTKRPRWQYKCDFCGKTGLSGRHMNAHEKHCTANPHRECRMHKYFAAPYVPVADLMRLLVPTAPNHGIDALREAAGGCPMCMLAAVRQSRICEWDGDPESLPSDVDWRFKDELKAAWLKINNAEDQGAR